MTTSTRDPLPGVLPIFYQRWSPRAFTPSPVNADALARIMDAARWSPSCFNDQPWRFYTSTDETFDQYLNLLNEKNRSWAKDASVIGFLIGCKTFRHNNQPNSSFALDCGAAWMAMSLQANAEGLHTHGLAGIDRQGVAEYLNLDTDTYAVLMGFVIGEQGSPDQLDDDMRSKEAPNGRLALDTIWRTAR